MVNSNLPENNEVEKEFNNSGNDDNGNGNTLSGCSSNDDANPYKSYARRRKCNENVQICEKQKKRESYQRISIILRKSEETRTTDELKQLEDNADIVRQINKRREHIANTRERVLEKEDPPEVIEEKARKLANVLSRAQHLVCYTGAGISTSARIPDYRGSQGIWTLLQQGKEIGQYDLSLAEPTFTHMSLFELHRRNILRYTLSQNCDGLHLRSGLPRKLLSEVHGNMYIEVCKYCKPNVEYWRQFDTTERTARYNHKTNRRCHFCFKPLIDTIVHFGERGRLRWPLNWEGACKNVEKADVILCLGSSLKVLKKYTWLWQMDRPKSKRPKIYIVNLQWTPKDKVASLKINGKCDEVMKLVMSYMNIKVAPYNRIKDPIFTHASLLLPEEVHTVSQPMLKHAVKVENENEEKEVVKKEMNEESTMEDQSELKNDFEKVEIKTESNVQMSDDIRTKNTEMNSTAVNENGLLNEKSENGQVNKTNEKSTDIEESLGDKERKDCSSTGNNDNDLKLPHIEHTAKSHSQCHEISNQPHYTNTDNNTELKQINEKTMKNHKILMKIGTMSTIKSELSFKLGNGDEKQDEGYFKSLINYYRAIDGVLPHWYDVNYAYSGLHSIINPPPNEVDIWSPTIIIPIHQLNRNLAECEFCFENYAEDKCQFYKPLVEFHVSVPRRRNGQRILCDCCNYDEFDNDVEQTSFDEIDGSEATEEDDTDSSRCKRLKLDTAVTAKVTTQRIVQPGWYGKGYRKTTKRKKTRRIQLR